MQSRLSALTLLFLLVLYLPEGSSQPVENKAPPQDNTTGQQTEPAQLETAPQPTATVPGAETKQQPQEDKWIVSAGVGFRDTSWSHFEDPSNTNTKYNVKNARNTIVRGDLSVPKVAAKFGINLQQEAGEFSEIKNFAGYFGIKKMSLVSERGKFSGSAYFSGNIAPGQSQEVSFDQEYQFTELDYSFSNTGVAMYFGLRHTKWKLPAEIALTSPGETSGPTVFDVDFETEFYSIIYGMDFLENDLLITEEWTPGWGVMFSFLVGLGWGESKIGQEAIDAVDTIYGKTVVDKNPPVFAVHTSGQIGPKYKMMVGKLKAVFGIGYDWNALLVLGMGEEAVLSSEVMASPYPNFIYQGLIARAHATF